MAAYASKHMSKRNFDFRSYKNGLNNLEKSKNKICKALFAQ